jgi:hypothetical protein
LEKLHVERTDPSILNMESTLRRKQSDSFDLDRDNTTLSSEEYSDYKIDLDTEESDNDV